MKVRKSIAALLLSALLVLTLLPVGAFAEVDESSSPTQASEEEIAQEQNISGKLSNWKLEIRDVNENVKSTSSYSAYKLISYDASYNFSSKKFDYTNMALTPAYRDKIITALGLSTSASDHDIEFAISNLKSDGLATLANTLKKDIGNLNYDKKTDTGVFSFNSSELGYYLVLETNSASNDGTLISKPILVNVPDNPFYYGTCGFTQYVTVKTSKASITKKIVGNDSNGNPILVDSSTAAVGDRIDYQSLSDIPAYSSNSNNITYCVTDTFSPGLTFVPGSVVVKIRDTSNLDTVLQSSYYDLNNSPSGGATFQIKLKDDSKIRELGNAGSKLLVTYSATLNNNAITGSTGNPNSIKLTCNTYNTPDDTVITYTSKLVITKVDNNKNPIKLKGAVFELYMGTDNPKLIDTQTTVDGGTATFTKLQQGSYILKETKAPDGYNLLSDPITFTVSAKNGSNNIPDASFIVDKSGNDAAKSVTATWSCTNGSFKNDGTGMNITIVNTPSFNLPGTGGIGTTIFFVSGAAILVLGGCMAVVYIRRKKKSTQHFQR